MVPAGGEMQNTLLDVIHSFLYEPRHFIAYSCRTIATSKCLR